MRAWRMPVTIAVVVIATLAVVACGGTDPPDVEPQLRGVVVTIDVAGGEGVMRVVWHEDAGALAEYDSMDVSVRPNTNLTGRDGQPIEPGDLKQRDIVEVWVSGPVAESYPPQAAASDVAVIGAFDPVLPLPIPPGLVEP